jgi:hypothetical protein
LAAIFLISLGHSKAGAAERLGSQAASMPDAPEQQCPRCGAELHEREAGASYVVECSSGCGWCAVTTNENTPAFDQQRYDVFLVTDLPVSLAAARAGVALARPAHNLRAAVSGSEPVVEAAEALEVLRVAGILARRGLAIRVEPEFRWTLPTPSDVA